LLVQTSVGKYSDFEVINFDGVRHRSVRSSPAAIAKLAQLTSKAPSNGLHDITEA
jgi:hypothetical protein